MKWKLAFSLLAVTLFALGASILPTLVGALTSPGCAPAALAAPPPSNTWAHSYGDGQGELSFAVAATDDGGSIVAGKTVLPSTAVWVVKLDAAGAIVWQEHIKLSAFDEAFAVAVSPDGGYVIGGHATGTLRLFKLSRAGDLVWDKTYGQGYLDQANAILATPDGGYVVAGEQYDNGWLLKLDADGNVLWSKTYDNLAAYERFLSIAATPDGGYVVAGYLGEDAYHKNDAWVVKVNSAGSVQWAKVLGGRADDEARAVAVSPEGGYVLAGFTDAGYLTADLWVAKLDAAGNRLWSKTFGGSQNDRGYALAVTSDSGYFVAGDTASFGGGSYDMWLLKLNSAGKLLGSKTYGGTDTDAARALALAQDGGPLLAGFDQLNGYNLDVVKVDANGNLGFPAVVCNFVHPAQPTVKDTGGTPRNVAVTVSDHPVVPTERQPVIDQVDVTITSQCEAPSS
jgi:WD40 repeat protein